MVFSFILDPMHLAFLGMMKRFLLLWLKGPLTCHIGRNGINMISDCFLPLRPYKPKESVQKPQWQATVFRLFLLYTGLIVLRLAFVCQLVIKMQSVNIS